MTPKAKRLHPGYVSLLFPDMNFRGFPVRTLLIHADTFTHSRNLVRGKMANKKGESLLFVSFSTSFRGIIVCCVLEPHQVKKHTMTGPENDVKS